MGCAHKRLHLLVLLLAYLPNLETKSQPEASKHSTHLSLMFNAWAVNKNAVNGPGYLKAADTLKKDEYEALKEYFKPIATRPVTELKEVQSIAQDNANIHGLFNKLESNARLSAQDVVRWKESLNKLHQRLLAALERRIGDDFNYSEFLREERARTLGNYQAAYVSRTALSKQVSVISTGSEKTQVELWSQVLKDPHTEMLIRMRQGVEILHATFLDFESQRFNSPEDSIKRYPSKKTVLGTEDLLDSSHLRTDVPPFKEGPNPLLPPLVEN